MSSGNSRYDAWISWRLEQDDPLKAANLLLEAFEAGSRHTTLWTPAEAEAEVEARLFKKKSLTPL